MIRTLRTPSAAAPSRSACRPRRLRSRVVSCMIGSTPASLTRWAAASGDRWTWAPVLSVQLTASACPRSAAARFRVTAGSGLSIADSSAVTTKWPCRRRAASRLGALRIRRLGDPAPGSPPIAARGQVDPGRAALQPPVDRWVEVLCVIAPQRQPARALPGLDPDAGPVGEDLAGAVGANAAAGTERWFDRDHCPLQQTHRLIHPFLSVWSISSTAWVRAADSLACAAPTISFAILVAIEASGA